MNPNEIKSARILAGLVNAIEKLNLKYTGSINNNILNVVSAAKQHLQEINFELPECNCGNEQFGFDCVCEWVKNNPGNISYSCEFCGMYHASKPRCSKCEPDTESF